MSVIEFKEFNKLCRHNKVIWGTSSASSMPRAFSTGDFHKAECQRVRSVIKAECHSWQLLLAMQGNILSSLGSHKGRVPM